MGSGWHEWPLMIFTVFGQCAADRRQPEIGRPSEDEQEQFDQQG